MRIVVLGLVLAGLASVPEAYGREIFVNNVAGNDAFLGSQPSQGGKDLVGPVRTLAKALRLTTQGDQIVLANTGKPYREGVTLMGLRHSGYSYLPLVIQGNGAVLDGSAPVPPDVWQHFRDTTFRFQPPKTQYLQLFLDDRPLVRVDAKAQAPSPPKLEPLQYCLHCGYLYFCAEDRKFPQDYSLSLTDKAAAITLMNVQFVTISNLTIQGFQLDGISAFNSAKMVMLHHLTCRGNGRSGVLVGGASHVSLESCLMGNNGTAQLLTLPWSETYLSQSELVSNTAPAWVTQGGRVFLNGKEIHGGLDEKRPNPAPAAKEKTAAPATKENASTPAAKEKVVAPATPATPTTPSPPAASP